ncbi:MAG TPA: hypothetical protein VF374_07690 [Thermoplasmata archaeon]|jgi:hypothetical protein
MLLLWSGNLEKGREMEYKRFMAKNLATFKKHAPPGWTLKGVYGATFYIGKYDVTWIWEFKKFADMDAARDYADPVYDSLSIEEIDFYIPGSFDLTILREVDDWRVTPPKKAKKQKK